MNRSERIVFNSAASYTRSTLAIGLALFSNRWILNALGETDFGLFSIVGSLIVFLGFFNGVMANSSSRHFAYAIGQDDTSSVNKWFNTSVSIHLVLPVVLILIGWPIAEYVIKNVLSIPPDRVGVCVLVFRISLISAFVNMVSVPFVAMFHAKQRITELAFWGFMQAVLTFFLAWILIRIHIDRLLFFAAGTAAIHLAIHFVKSARALWLFRECRVRLAYWFDNQRLKELFGFASWTLIGKSGGMMRNQGSSILLNLYFGPAVNAAYGIANQVSVQTATLSAAMMGAMSPEITVREGQGLRDSMINLSVRACKFGALLVLLFAIPFVLEAHLVLKLWLINPPPHSVVLSQLILVTFLIDKAAAGYMYAVAAHGKIAAYQATIGTLLLLTLPLAWLFLKLGLPPFSVGVAFILIQSICSYGRVLWVRYLFGVPVQKWLTRVIRPLILVAAITCAAAAVPRFLLPPDLIRLFLVCAVSLSITASASWIIALTSDEKIFFVKTMQKTVGRITRRIR